MMIFLVALSSSKVVEGYCGNTAAYKSWDDVWGVPTSSSVTYQGGDSMIVTVTANEFVYDWRAAGTWDIYCFYIYYHTQYPIIDSFQLITISPKTTGLDGNSCNYAYYRGGGYGWSCAGVGSGISYDTLDGTNTYRAIVNTGGDWGDAGVVGAHVVRYRSLCPTPNTNGTPTACDADGDGYRTDIDCNDNDNSTYPGAPEICDGKDNQCAGIGYGTVDEGCDKDDDDYCDSLMTKASPYSCNEATNNNCCNSDGNDCNDNNNGIYPGAAEKCNGVDDDCDNQSDEVWLQVVNGTNMHYNIEVVGVCHDEGYYACKEDGSGVKKIAINRTGVTTETCDGIDNDCDTYVDNNPGTTTDHTLTRLATCGIGACYRSVPQTCPLRATAWTPACIPGTPTSDICDNLDNDCDGKIDEDLGSTTCGIGACQRTVQNCVGGITQTCIPGTPTAEVCDGRDNDCDGETNEGLPNCNVFSIFRPVTFNVTILDANGQPTIDTKDIIAYTWDFGDGTKFGTMHPHEALPVTHTYTTVTDGAYTVIFRMMDKNFNIYETSTDINIELQINDGICTKNSDCESGYCNPIAKCSIQNCTDTWKNQDETDVDCGGDACPKCGLYKKCLDDDDCGVGYGNPPENKLYCINKVCFYRPPDQVQTTVVTVVCGNNLKEGSEVCDGASLGGQTCVSRGYTSGTLSCLSDCSNFDTSNCYLAVCGNGILDTGEECDDNNIVNYDGCSPSCQKENIVFLTSGKYDGNLGGLTGADAKCQAEAATAGLTGTYKAWLSTSANSASSRLTHSTEPYYLTTGTIVANSWSDLTQDGVINAPIDKDAKGDVACFPLPNDFGSIAVWTATNFDGGWIGIVIGGADCNSWTTTSASGKINTAIGWFGTCVDYQNGWWTNRGMTMSCSGKYRLYCFSQ